MNQILLQEWNTPFHAFPFDQIRQEDYEPAIHHLLHQAKTEIQAIAQDQASPTFSNTIEALEKSGLQLNRVVEAFFNINSAETNGYIQEITQKLAPQLAAYSNDMLLNQDLFHRVKEVYDHRQAQELSPEQSRLLEQTYKRFVRNGALLDQAAKEELRKIDERTSVLKVKFSQNVLQETNDFLLLLTSAEDILGIPESVLLQAKETAENKNMEGYVFTLHFPSYVPFMKYAQNRTHRAAMYQAYHTRGYKDNPYNNEAVIKELVLLKNKRAVLLGYRHHADFVLEERMAKDTETVDQFLNELLSRAKPYAIREIGELKALAATDGIDELLPYDHAYYAEQLRTQKYNYSEETLKSYFPLSQVMDAAFDLSYRLFGLTFEKVSDIPVYHEEVNIYKVSQNGSFKALLYTDFHPREGKRPGAWMTSFRGQYIDREGNHRPHISIVCNFSRASKDTPSLLTFNEVTTLFHEFGHALHGILADTQYESLSGTNVYWDFVELPSQFLENYCYSKPFLSSFAKHWKDGTPLDLTEIDKIIAASNFMEGYQTVRQISFGILDMAYYSGEEADSRDLSEFEQAVTAPARLYPHLDHTCLSTSFGHIFGGGYAAGYYSYKWAEVLDADAYAYFEETGIFNRDTAHQYEILLSKGGTEDPMKLYKEFRGREPKMDALLERAGLNGSL